MQGGACGIAVIIGAPETNGTYIHGDVTIEGNEIVSDLYPSECGIAVGNTTQAVLKDNIITGCKAAVHAENVKEMILP